MDPGDLRKMFRGFFGFPDFQQRDNSYHEHDAIIDITDDSEEADDDGGRDPHFRNSRGFTVLSDPLEIHKYFDQQMDEMLKVFGGSFGFGFSGGFGHEDRDQDTFRGFGNFHPGIFGQRMIPFQDDEVDPRHGHSEDQGHGHARDFMLKEDSQPRVDSEVDWDKINKTDIDQLLKSREKPQNDDGSQDKGVRPFGFSGGFNFDMRPGGGFSFDMNPGSNKSFSFGSSMSERTVRGPNGGVESTRTVKNSDGSETVSVTKELGDQSYSVVTTRDKNGAETSEEKFFNINKSELEDFKNKFNSKSVSQHRDPREDMIVGPQSDPTYSKLWDKFFGN